MRSIAEVRERQTGERNLTGLRESKSQDDYDRQEKENRSKGEKMRKIDKRRESELDNGAEGREEERAKRWEWNHSEVSRCCNLLSMANTQQMCGSRGLREEKGSRVVGGPGGWRL